ncbi:MAG: sugar kinase [Vampirovibrionales bacterium]|nr:sugar kinase [Vampirovibrionales bacterium]
MSHQDPNSLLRDPLSQPNSAPDAEISSAITPGGKNGKSKKALDLVSIGEAMVELSCLGDMRFANTMNKSFGGDTFNTLIAAQRLGSKTAYVTRLGSDPFAYMLRDAMIKEGVNVNQTRISQTRTNPNKPQANESLSGAGQTGLYITSVGHDGERTFCYYRKNSAATALSPEDLNPDAITSAKVVFASGVTLAISESARQTVHRAFKIARDNNVTTALDINYRESLWKGVSHALDALNELLPLVDVILPSTPDDTQGLIGFSKPEQIIDYFLFKGVQVVAVKAGRDGCYIGYKKEVIHVPALVVQAVDTTGAGDAFNGGFLHGLACGFSLLESARIGVTAAGLKVTGRGTMEAMPYKDAVYSRVF